MFTPATALIAELLTTRSSYLQKLQTDFSLFASALQIRYFFEELAVDGRILVWVPP
jgi:hypothetical protein